MSVKDYYRRKYQFSAFSFSASFSVFKPLIFTNKYVLNYNNYVKENKYREGSGEQEKAENGAKIERY